MGKIAFNINDKANFGWNKNFLFLINVKNLYLRRESTIESVRAEVLSLNNQLEDLQQDMSSLRSRSDETLRYSDSITRQNVNLKSENTKLLTKIETLIEKVTEVSESSQKARIELMKNIDECQATIQKLEGQNEELKYKVSQNEINALRENKELNKNNSTNKNSVHALNQVINELKQQISELRSKLKFYEDKADLNSSNGSTGREDIDIQALNRRNNAINKTHNASIEHLLKNKISELMGELEVKNK